MPPYSIYPGIDEQLQFPPAIRQALVNSPEFISAVTTPLASKADLVNGLIPTSQLPPQALVSVQTAASQTAMLALTAQAGDVAIRSDLTPARTFMLAAAPATTLSNWKEFMAPGQVLSVAGRSGIVALTQADIQNLPTVLIDIQTQLTSISSRVTSVEINGIRAILSETQPTTLPIGYLWGKPVPAIVVDNTPPAAPVLDVITLNTGGKPALSWSAVTDSSGIAFYRIIRNGVVIDVSVTTGYQDETALPSTTYTYQVRAVDASTSENESALSNSRSVATAAASLRDNPNLRVLYDFNTRIEANGSAISGITPTAGTWTGMTLEQATVAVRPILTYAAVGGRKSLKFISLESRTIQAYSPFALTGDTTEFIVARVTPHATSQRHAVVGINTAPSRGIAVSPGGSPKWRATVPSVLVPALLTSATAYAPSTAPWRIVGKIARADGTVSFYDHALTAQALGALGVGADNAINGVRFGREAGSSTAYSDSEIAYYAIVEGAMTNGDAQSAMSEIAALFSISLGL